METVPEEPVIVRLREEMSSYLKILGSILPESQWRQIQENAVRLEEEGLPAAVSRQIAILPFLDDFLPVVSLAGRTGNDLFSVARTLNDVRDFLDMKEILRQMEGVQVRDRWDRMAYQMLKAGFIAVIHDLTLAIWRERDGNLETFFGARRQKVAFFRNLRESLRGATPANYHPLTVLVRALEDLIPRR
jgi:NAD-specific glutamate dehydrogenase